MIQKPKRVSVREEKRKREKEKNFRSSPQFPNSKPNLQVHRMLNDPSS
jgi:hypothetical protein